MVKPREVPDLRLLRRRHRARAGPVERVPSVRDGPALRRAGRSRAVAPTSARASPRQRSSWRLAVAFVAHACLAARTDLIVFTGRRFIAAACAVAIRDFERGAHASIAVGIGTLLLCAIFHHDFHEMPEKAYQAFGVDGRRLPRELQGTVAASLVRSPSAASGSSPSSPGSSATRSARRSTPQATPRSSAPCATPGTASWCCCGWPSSPRSRWRRWGCGWAGGSSRGALGCRRSCATSS